MSGGKASLSVCKRRFRITAVCRIHESQQGKGQSRNFEPKATIPLLSAVQRERNSLPASLSPGTLEPLA